VQSLCKAVQKIGLELFFADGARGGPDKGVFGSGLLHNIGALARRSRRRDRFHRGAFDQAVADFYSLPIVGDARDRKDAAAVRAGVEDHEIACFTCPAAEYSPGQVGREIGFAR
jgi:hypothetical protein